MVPARAALTSMSRVSSSPTVDIGMGGTEGRNPTPRLCKGGRPAAVRVNDPADVWEGFVEFKMGRGVR